MLTENELIDLLAKHLDGCDYTVTQKRKTWQRGIDIVCRSGVHERRLLVEAKGATSAREGSPRKEKGFDRKQARSHVGRAFYQGAKLQADHPNDEVALAFPDDVWHREFAQAIAPALATLHMRVFLVSVDGKVSLMNDQLNRGARV